jgi:hypothetical protein
LGASEACINNKNDFADLLVLVQDMMRIRGLV